MLLAFKDAYYIKFIVSAYVHNFITTLRNFRFYINRKVKLKSLKIGFISSQRLFNLKTPTLNITKDFSQLKKCF